MKKLFFLLITVAGLSVNSFAQTASAGSSATIVTPISIAKVSDLKFGLITASGSAATVAVDAASSVTTTLTMVAGITPAAASFTVSGSPSATYTITLPPAFTLTGPGTAMTVDGFVTNPTPTGQIGAGGTQTLNVGATLHVNASQTAGLYTNAAGLSITVAYN